MASNLTTSYNCNFFHTQNYFFRLKILYFHFSMRYPLAANLAELLFQSLQQGKQFDHSMQQLIKTDKRMGSKDRRLLANAGYSILRKAHFYQAIMPEVPVKQKYWNMVALWYQAEYSAWPKWDTISAETDFKTSEGLSVAQELGIAESLYQEFLAQYGEDKAKELIQTMDKEGPVCIRVNKIRCTAEQLKNQLEAEGVQLSAIKDHEDAYIITERTQLLNLSQYKQGWFEIQDIGSQEIANFVSIPSKGSFLDACAGSCGKSLAVASDYQNSVRIVAHDIHPNRLEKAKERIKRAAAHIDLVSHQQLFDSGWEFDSVLIDAPCTGSGTLKRKPQMKWDFTEEYLHDCVKQQWLCLLDYPKLVKVGGECIYATCSVLQKENQDQVQKFLEAFPEFELIEEKVVLPSDETDGFYMAKMKRNS